MRILLTNDDGIYAPGLRALLAELRKIGDVTVVAPATEQSAVGHSVTLTAPLIVQEVRDETQRKIGWAVEGRPADCVKLAIRELLPEPPDLLVSGLNAGSNAGINVLYSGTVAAAIEGAFFRITSIACSLEVPRSQVLDFPRGAAYARQVVERILAHKPETGSLFNVNIPDLEKGPIKGIRTLPQNIAPYVETFDRRTNPRGKIYFWSDPAFRCPDPHPDTDVTALQEGYITVTPLQFNLTHERMLREIEGWDWGMGEANQSFAVVHNRDGTYINKAAISTEADYINGVKSPGKYDATVGSEAQARRIVQQALPHAQELPPAVAGQPYPSPPPGVKAWFQVQPAEPDVGNMLPHIKYADWTGGKKGSGGTWGHLFFPS